MQPGGSLGRAPLRLAGFALLLLVAEASAAYRGLNECPDLRPRSPARRLSSELRDCQQAVAEAGALFVEETLAAQSACLDRALAGAIARPERACLGLRKLASGETVLPRDAATAERIREAFRRSEEQLVSACSDADLAALPDCGDDQASTLACLWANHWEHTQHVLERTHGEVGVVADAAARSCQTALAGATAELVLAEQRARAGTR